MFAYAGRILYVDLSRHKIFSRRAPKSLISTFIGGRGVNAKLLWELTEPGVNSLSPENVLIFGTGALTCTTAPSSGRMTVTCKSPLTNLYLKSSVGGHVGAELKFAGYDNLVIRGSSNSPVYLVIADDEVSIKDASHLWGMQIKDVNNTIKKELGDDRYKIACIGPAGENLVPYSAIICSVYNVAARGGTGAVMGSKKLKAIAVRGTGAVSVKYPEKFADLSQRLRAAFLNDMQGRKYFLFGTGTFDPGPGYNYLMDPPESGDVLSGPYLVKKGYVKRHIGCFGCTQSCHRYTEVISGPYARTYTLGPEYETFSALGAGIGVLDPETVIKINDIATDLGLDTISTGVTLEWVMECYERGVLTKEDTDGLELKFGNDDAVLRLLPMIAKRQGKIGWLLSQGVKKASETVGKGSYRWAMANSKGLEHSKVDTRIVKSYALAFAVNPRGPDHLHTECMAAWGGSGAARALIERITDARWPDAATHYPEIVKWHEEIYAAAEALGFCAFTCTSAHAILEAEMVELYFLATGIRMDAAELLGVGERILTLEKCFNVREGADRRLDDLPWRIMNDPVPGGIFQGMVTSEAWLNEMLDRYYALHGWDVKTSWPTEDTLTKLKLGEIVKKLKTLGRIP